MNLFAVNFGVVYFWLFCKKFEKDCSPSIVCILCGGVDLKSGNGISIRTIMFGEVFLHMLGR